MDTKNKATELVNTLILLTTQAKINWRAYSVHDPISMQIPKGFEIDGMAYVTTFHEKNFRLIKYQYDNDLFSGHNWLDRVTNPGPFFQLQIYDPNNDEMLFEFPKLSQLYDLYSVVSTQVFDFDAFYAKIVLTECDQ